MMSRNRRSFLKHVAGASALTVLGSNTEAQASGGKVNPNQLGVLVDCTWCVGCRSCEKACNACNAAHDGMPERSAEEFKDMDVFAR